MTMKRQVIFESEQLHQIVNESARRVLRELVNEGFLGSALANTANVLKIASMLPMVPDIMNGVEKLVSKRQGPSPGTANQYQGGGLGNYIPGNPSEAPVVGQRQQMSAEDLVKLYNTDPEAFKAIAQNPSLLSQLSAGQNAASQPGNDPYFTKQSSGDQGIQDIPQMPK